MGDRKPFLRILYSFPHALGLPGIGRTAWHQVDELIRAGHQVHVVTTRLATKPPPGATAWATLPSPAGWAAGRMMGTDRAMAWNDAVTSRVLRTTRDRFDVLHTWPAGGLRAIRTASRHGVTTVRELPNTHTEHAYVAASEEAAAVGVLMEPQHSHAYRGPRLAREMMEYAEATALLAPSEVVVRSFLDRGFDPQRVLRHRYGYDPRQFRLEDARSRRPYGPGRPLRALFVGRAEPRKGLHLALRAWRASRASRCGTFTICGAFAPGYREALGDLLAGPRVEVMGFVPNPSRMYVDHDVLVLPSVEEGSALVTYEASAMGCLPLVSDASGADCEHGRDALVHPTKDWRALAAQMDRLVDQPALLTEMQETCIRERERLTWTAGTAVTVEAYRRAMSLQPPAHGEEVP